MSRNGEVTTTARFAWGTDMAATVLAVRERLDNARAAAARDGRAPDAAHQRSRPAPHRGAGRDRHRGTPLASRAWPSRCWRGGWSSSTAWRAWR